MLFYTYLFVFWFLPCCVGCYYLLLKFGQPRLALLSLIGFSLLFYGWWNPHYLWVLIGSICLNYLLSKLLMFTQEKKPPLALILVALGVMGNLVVLAHYKYWCLLGGDGSCQSIALPLAISFFTFQQIEFLLDTWNGKIGPQSFASYFLFVSFFPHLIAGPITRHSEMMPQFERPSGRVLANLSIGITIFAIGLSKKVFFADSVANFTAPPFESAANGYAVPLLPAWLAVIGFTLQLYFDFSGYSDMAIGISRMFGIKLPLNFNSPFKATNIVDFWQRWHLTLTRYITIHLYNPMVVSLARVQDVPNRAGSFWGLCAGMAVPTLVVMTIAGIWHGAGSQFVVFGLMHGCLLAGYQMFRWMGRRWYWVESIRKILPDKLCVAATFLLVAVSFVFFKATSIDAAAIILKGMMGFVFVPDPSSLADHQGILKHLALRLGQEDLRPIIINLTYGYGELLILPVCLAILWLAPNTQQIMGRYMNDPVAKPDPEGSVPVHYSVPPTSGALNDIAIWQPTRMVALVVTALVVTALMKANYRSAVFLYFQF